jgi:hypothetical protein
MSTDRSRRDHHGEAPGTKTQTKVDVFEVKRVALVQAFFAAHQQASTAHGVHLDDIAGCFLTLSHPTTTQ